MREKKKPTLGAEIPTKEKMRDIASLFFILCSAFLFISLWTYSPRDIASIGVPVQDPPGNKGGRLGAQAAYTMFSHLGLAAYLLVGLVIFWSFQVFFRRKVRGLWMKLVAAYAMVLATSTFLNLQPLFSAGTFGLEGTAPGLGGIYGTAIEGVLVANFGKAGAFLCVMLALGVSTVLATDWLIYTGALAMGRVGRLGWAQIARRFTKEAREERRRSKLEAARVELTRVAEKQRQAPAPVVPVSEPPKALEAKPVMPVIKREPKATPSVPSTSVVVGVTPHQSPKKMAPYEQPPLSLFESKVERIHGLSENEIRQRTHLIEQTLREFNIEVKVVNYEVGPSVTIYELALSPGTRIHDVVARQDEISMKLAVPPVRVVGPIPGKDTVGIEVPNPFPDTVRIREFLERDYAGLRKVALPILLGKTNAGEVILRSLTDMPHMLIAGTTGSGKSVCLKSIITGLICSMSWEEMKLILIDPKMVELTAFCDIPHLWTPVVTDSKKAAMVLEWVMREMDERYMLLNKVGSRNIESFNQLGEKKIHDRLAEAGLPEEDVKDFPTYLPYIVVIIDELADLMLTARKEVEHSIIRISQKARAVGIHMVVATQRPSVDVITGLIRSNMPSRVGFRVASSIESRIILDGSGAERLLGKGDMLMRMQGMFSAVRAQCTFVSDDELRGVVTFLKSKGKPEYHTELVALEAVMEMEGTADDDLFEEAVRVILTEQRGSVSFLQRKLSIGYTRAARLVDEMQKYGIVGPQSGAGPRAVLMTLEQWDARRNVTNEDRT